MFLKIHCKLTGNDESAKLGRSGCYFPVRQSSAREGDIAEGVITVEGVITI